jgi:dienelactone hydrolase
MPSVTVSDEDFLNGRKDGVPVMLAGELRIPRMGTDRLPAVILVHGSAGVSGFVDDWAQLVNAMGVATFVLDSYTGRGLVSTVSDQSQLGRFAMVIDIYRALELLVTHPRIDRTRVAVMGFSRGGIATLYSSMKRFQRLHGPQGAEFAAYIVFYADCNVRLKEDEELADKPIRLFHGSADDWVPVGPCREYVERLRVNGKDVALAEYADAKHVFDWPLLKKPLHLPNAQNLRNCSRHEASGGRIVRTGSGLPFTYSDSCVERGASAAYHPQAHAEAQKAVRDLIHTTLLAK